MYHKRITNQFNELQKVKPMQFTVEKKDDMIWVAKVRGQVIFN